MSTGALRPEELENLQKFKPWIETYGESIYGTDGGPYISGQWGGSCMKGNTLYLHVFEWTNNKLVLPAFARKVLHCEEPGGEKVIFSQNKQSLTLELKKGKARSLHSVVKLKLEDGPAIPLIEVNEKSNEKGKPRT